MNAAPLEHWLPEQPRTDNWVELQVAEIRRETNIAGKVRSNWRRRVRELEETALDCDDTTP